MALVPLTQSYLPAFRRYRTAHRAGSKIVLEDMMRQLLPPALLNLRLQEVLRWN